MELSLGNFVTAACFHIEMEKRQLTPDNTLIAVLCDAVRLAREVEDHYRKPK